MNSLANLLIVLLVLYLLMAVFQPDTVALSNTKQVEGFLTSAIKGLELGTIEVPAGKAGSRQLLEPKRERSGSVHH